LVFLSNDFMAKFILNMNMTANSIERAEKQKSEQNFKCDIHSII